MLSRNFDFDLTIVRGDGRQLDLVVYQNAGTDPQDLTDALLWFTGKRRLSDSDADAVMRYTGGNGITVTDAPAGAARVTIAGADTADLPDGNVELLCDVQVKLVGSDPYTAAFGRITVQPDVTRALG